MKAAPLSKWLETEAPSRAVLLGKGPSLDEYFADQHARGAFVMAINEAAEVKPCHAAIYIDSFKLDVPRSTIVFRPPTATGSPVDRAYLFKRGKPRGPSPGDEDTHIPQHGFGTSTAAVTILGMWGVRNILMVGFDAKGSERETAPYAECLRGKLRPHSAQSYAGIHNGTQAALDAYGISALWFHRGERWPDE